MERLLESLSPNERKVMQHLDEKDINNICKKTNLDKTSVLRALEFLQNKKILTLSTTSKKVVDVGVNGALYRTKGLPERQLLNLLAEKRIIPLKEAQKESKLSDEEFKASIGALKRKAMIDLKNEKIVFNASKEEISKKSLEEKFLELLPIEYTSITPEQMFALKNLEKRKDIILIEEEKTISIEISPLGKDLMKHGIKQENYIEQITQELIQKELWRGKKFRRYDLTSPVPSITGGKRHFVNQATDYGRKIWTEMGFKEMSGNMIQSSFWNFDALFQPQDHPVRDMHDTFFINKKAKLPDKKIINAVKESHEKGVAGSKGWRYEWNEEEAKRYVLRTHTTCFSAQTLANLKPENIPAKFFAIGRNFRNETLDWKHGFEFNQTEGIVVDENANFRNLIGYLKEFANKMGYKKIRIRPGYFPYTEPSLEGDVWDENRKEWVELLAAGIFRPEVTQPLLGKPIPVLAWGPGFDRMLLKIFEINDLRDFYKNDLNKLRKTRFLVKL